MTNIQELLKYGYNQLRHIESSQLDTEVLLSFVLKKPREYLLAHPDEIISNDKVAQFSGLLRQRAQHKPIAYLIKQKDFCGRAFFIDERTHIPRPATEDLIDYIKDLVSPGFDGTIADIGTGSGCIAITLALLYPQAMIIATDISEDALVVARHNALLYRVENHINFLRGDLLSPLKELDSRFRLPAGRHGGNDNEDTRVDIIVSNPPYGWLNHWTDDDEVFHQPRLSYNGGDDGLNVIKRLLADILSHLKTDGQAFLEFDPRQREALTAFLGTTNFSWQIKKDLAGFDRIVRLTY